MWLKSKRHRSQRLPTCNRTSFQTLSRTSRKKQKMHSRDNSTHYHISPQTPILQNITAITGKIHCRDNSTQQFISPHTHNTSNPSMVNKLRLKLLQWNIRSVYSHLGELKNYLLKSDPDIICLQETFLKPEHTINSRERQPERQT